MQTVSDATEMRCSEPEFNATGKQQQQQQQQQE